MRVGFGQSLLPEERTLPGTRRGFWGAITFREIVFSLVQKQQVKTKYSREIGTHYHLLALNLAQF
jgi:hypothetical protein